MSWRYEKVEVKRVGPTNERFALEVGRGVLTLDSLLDYIAQPVSPGLDEIIVDLSKVGWVGLFEWSSLMALLHGRLVSDPHVKISIDFIGDRPTGHIPYSDCKAFIDNPLPAPRYNRADVVNSYVVHGVLNFIKAVEGPEGFDNVAGGRIVLRWLSDKEARDPGWFRRDREVEDSVFFSRENVSAAEMSTTFAKRSQVEVWRQGMREKHVPEAAVFASDEFWRILCHELARNVSEHAEGPGFLTARVVLPSNGALPRWCNDVLSGTALERSQITTDSGFLELCVCDAGVGIPETVKTAFRNRYQDRWAGAKPPDPIPHLDLLKFAFDELGTRKDRDHSWLTDRHALGHILFLVGKYGGSLTIRSGRSEVSYAPKDGACHRCKNRLGYEPEAGRNFSLELPGTHIQIIVPLIARPPTQGTRPRGVLTQHLPQSYHVDPKHPVGPLVPVSEKLDVLASCVNGDEICRFQESCRALAKALLLGGHPRDEIVVFDFAEVDWQPARFETFLYLFQNVLVGRLVIFTNMKESFAKAVCAFEENAEAPSFLPEEMKNEIRERAREREFTDGRFLETYSCLGAVVLGLGPDTGEYLFGLRDRRLRAALLEIVAGEEQTAEGLAKTHGLEVGTLKAVLSAARTLLRCRKDMCWELAWTRNELTSDDEMIDTLEVQRLRSIIGHFGRVVSNCDAWRRSATPYSALNPLPARFYLPSENTVYMGFFESSRILARDRYVTEVAERLIHRIWYGLTKLCTPARNLSEIRVLACSTTPSFMLAQAVRRAWPVDAESERPVVVDYGPALFSGADPARIPSSEHPHHAVVIHDVFDEGRLSSRLIAMAQAQRIEVLLEASFVRFLKPDEQGEGDSVPFAVTEAWNMLNMANRVSIPVHAMVGIVPPEKKRRGDVADWGSSDEYVDYVVDPRSLRPVLLRSLRLESGVSEDRSLTKRDPYLKELDTDDGQCRLAAGHFVYGQRHFGVVADVRGILTGAIGRQITAWLADVCCDETDRPKPPWETREGDRPVSSPMPEGEVSAILMPLHSQIHYLLPGLQIELAQRGKRVPHFFLAATAFGSGVETYHAPYQLLNQIEETALEIKTLMDAQPNLDPNAPEVIGKQLRLLIIDDAIFSGRTIQTLVDSIGKKHLPNIRERIYHGESRYAEPVEWIRVFVVLNQLPAAQSAMWYQLQRCSVCEQFRFDAFAPFIGVATYTADDCPACRELEHLDQVERRAEAAGATAAVDWLRARRNALLPLSIEAPSFGHRYCPRLPEAIEVLALSGNTARERYNPLHADSAIWRFLELMFLSYPLSDVLGCLTITREAGIRYPTFRSDYARFRHAVYNWCIRNWNQVLLYQLDEIILQEIHHELKDGEPEAVQLVLKLAPIAKPQNSSVIAAIKAFIDLLADEDTDRRRSASEQSLALDIGLTLLLLSLRRTDIESTGLLTHLRDKQTSMPRKSSFLALLYLRLTRPLMPDPKWALSTIAEICYRGRLGKTPTDRLKTDHELLGRLVVDVGRYPRDIELRRRLEGSLHAFVAAVENLRPYFHEGLLSAIYGPAQSALEWLRIPLTDESVDTDPIYNLSQALFDTKSWAEFECCCHMSAAKLKEALDRRLVELKESKGNQNLTQTPNPYDRVNLRVTISPGIEDWCLMTHVSELVAHLSNLAIEPGSGIEPSGPSHVVIRPSHPGVSADLTIDVFTRFGHPDSALARVNSRIGNAARTRERLEIFGVVQTDAVADLDYPSEGIQLSLYIPVGFKPNRR